MRTPPHGLQPVALNNAIVICDILGGVVVNQKEKRATALSAILNSYSSLSGSASISIYGCSSFIALTAASISVLS